MRRWSITTVGERPSIRSTSGRAHFGSRLRVNGGNVSVSWNPASAAIVSNTSDDLPDPDTPTNTTTRPRGTSTSRDLRLLIWAPLIWMHRSAMAPTLG